MGFLAHFPSIQRISFPLIYGDLNLIFDEALKRYMTHFSSNPYWFCWAMRSFQVISIFFFKALVKLVECAINTKDIFLINLWRIEIDFLHIRTNSLKTRRLWQTWLLQALRGKLHVQTVESLLQNFILEF